MIFGGGGNDDDRNPMAGLALAILAPFAAMVVQLAISRTREYDADEDGSRLTGDPLALASALAKLEQTRRFHPYEFAGPATAHLFIVNPMSGSLAAFMNLVSTHPPIEDRIRRLRAMR